MADFTNLKKSKKAYGGANGGKISVIYKDELYMIKFPPIPKKNKNLSYGNNCIAEYIGSHVYQMLGIQAQDTLLGTYKVKEKEKIVVVCKDFTSPGIVLQDFASVKNQIIDSERNGYGTELSEILNTFEEQDVIDKRILIEHFWNMFIIDAFIGNWDRHNGNWGFLYDTINDSLELAPIYDCGSSLFPQADETMMQNILNDEKEINFRIYNIPTSSITLNDKRINYFDFISSLENEDCNLALKRITKQIDMKQIEELINNTPYISDLEKIFYKTMLNRRKERILDFSLNKLLKKELTTPGVDINDKINAAEMINSKQNINYLKLDSKER